MARIYICQGTNTRFQARARWAGYRHYDLIGKPSKSSTVAIMRMARAFAEHGYKRADVIMTADYYDPVHICELVRR